MTPPQNVDEDWRDQAACRNAEPDVFFPEKSGTPEPAKAICATCPVTAECLDYALTNDERFGVWGGLSERQRRRLNQAQPRRPSTAQCGTTGGYQRHHRLAEPTCLACKAANSAYRRKTA